MHRFAQNVQSVQCFWAVVLNVADRGGCYFFISG